MARNMEFFALRCLRVRVSHGTDVLIHRLRSARDSNLPACDTKSIPIIAKEFVCHYADDSTKEVTFTGSAKNFAAFFSMPFLGTEQSLYSAP